MWECREHGAPTWTGCQGCDAAGALNRDGECVVWRGEVPTQTIGDALARLASQARSDAVAPAPECTQVPRLRDAASVDDFPTSLPQLHAIGRTTGRLAEPHELENDETPDDEVYIIPPPAGPI